MKIGLKAGFRLVAILTGLCVRTNAEPSSSINWTNLQQHIDGFGFSSAWCGTLSIAKNNALYNTLGMSLLRIRIDENNNWNAESNNAAAAHAYGVKVLGCAWKAPAYMTYTNVTPTLTNCYLLPNAYNAYALWLNQAANYHHLDYVSVLNEPNLTSTDPTYLNMTADQIRIFCVSNAPSIGRPVTMADAFNFSDSVSDPTLNDSNAVNNVSIVSGHFYGGGNYVHANALAHGKPVWMTEHYLPGGRDNFAVDLNLAKEINAAMTNQFSAYIAWWAQDGDTNINLANTAGYIYKDGYTLGQFAKFIRPGYYRIGTSNTVGSAQISAYKDLASSNFVIVALNLSSTVITQQFNLSGFPASSSSITPWITSYTQSLAAQTPMTNFGPSFTYAIQPSNIVTFVGHVLLPYSILLAIPASATEGDGVLAGQGNITLTTTSSNALTVDLTSSNTNKVTVPSSAVIPAGQSNAVFDLTIVNDTLLDGDQNVNITATATNYYSGQATILVHSTNTATLTVTLPATATKGAGTLVNAGLVSASSTVAANFTATLVSSDTSKLAVPSSVTIQAGQSSAPFNLTVLNDNIIDGPQTVSVTASVPNWTSGSNSMTILDDNPLPDHFAWSAISSPQWAGGPFHVTITAQDASNNVVDFRLPVTLSAYISGSTTGTNMLLNSPATDQSATDPPGSPDYTLGYAFTVNTNVYVTHVRSCFGGKISIWNASGQLLATQAVVSVSGTWVDTPLSSPVFLSAGATYLVAVHEDNVEYFWSQSLPNTFANGTINETFWDEGDVFPQTADPFTQWYYVDLRYGTDLTPALINPAMAATFTNGVWSGNLAVLQPGNNVFLQAVAGAGSSGVSGAFKVLAAPRLAITGRSNAVVLSWPTNAAGFVLEQSPMMFTNWTNDPVSPVVLSNYNVVTNIPTQTATFYRLYKPGP